MSRALLALLGWLCLTACASAFPQTYDPDASTYFLQLSINGCATPSANFKAAVNDYIIAEKAVLNWGGQDLAYIMATSDSCTAATNLAQPSLYKLTWAGSCVYSVANGLQGDGSTCDGDIGVNESTLTRVSLNSSHFDACTAGSSSAVFGNTGSFGAIFLNAVTNKASRSTSSATLTDTGGGNAGCHYADRSDSANLTTGKNGVVQSNAVANSSSALTAQHFTICLSNATFCSNSANIFFVGVGTPLTSESSHYTNVRNLLIALGATGI